MSSEAKHPRAPWLGGRRWYRRAWWASARRKEREALKQRQEPAPTRHRHIEKWERT